MDRGRSEQGPSRFDRPARERGPAGPPKGLRDIDSAERAHKMKAASWLAFAGVGLFLGGTMAGAEMLGLGPLLALLFGLAVAGSLFLVYFALLEPFVIGGFANFVGRIYGGGPDARGLAPSFWRAEAMGARGEYSEALAAYDQAAERHPDDPRPCLRAAALCAEEMDDPQAAVRWYLRVRTGDSVAPETDAYVAVRLAELYESRLGRPGRAMVELRRLLTLYPESGYAAAARRRLSELKGNDEPEDG